MSTIEFVTIWCTILSIGFATASAAYWHCSSKVPMPEKAEIGNDLPGMGLITLHGEDYSVTFARINEGLSRLDASMVAINRSSRLNSLGARYAMLTALVLAIGLVLSLIEKIGWF